jgi:CRP-like cAMP-binding protein
MSSGRAISLESLIGRLDDLADMTLKDRALVTSILRDGASHPGGSVLLQQGQAVAGPRLLVAGWAWRMRSLPNGQRQVFALVLPGDFIGLCWRPRPRALSSTVAITPVTTCDAGALLSAVRNGVEDHSGLHEALTLSSRHDEMRVLDHVVRLGRQNAVERMASFLLELDQRLRNVGLADDDAMPFPLSQDALGIVLGMSGVHVNRTLQTLKRDGMAELAGGQARLLNREGLRTLSGFEAMARPYAEAI